MQKAGLFVLAGAWLSLSGCAAGRGTYFIAEGQRYVNTAKESGAPDQAIFAWTMADEYRRKAWEEWSSSDYEEAERLSKLAEDWAQKAEGLARGGGAIQILSAQPSRDEIKNALKRLEEAPPAPATSPAPTQETSP